MCRITDHAISRMRQREISETEILDALEFGKRAILLDKKAYEYKLRNVIVVTDYQNVIITVYRENYVQCKRDKRKIKTKDFRDDK